MKPELYRSYPTGSESNYILVVDDVAVYFWNNRKIEVRRGDDAALDISALRSGLQYWKRVTDDRHNDGN
jgi:hypothetical protein